MPTPLPVTVPELRAPLTRFWPVLSLRAAGSWLMSCYDRHLQRQDLAGLDARLRGDIGRSSEEIRRECAKPCWRR
jgi:uncharacterized protein YjiS (DUF1127 family)